LSKTVAQREIVETLAHAPHAVARSILAIMVRMFAITLAQATHTMAHLWLTKGKKTRAQGSRQTVALITLTVRITIALIVIAQAHTIVGLRLAK
jgi:hypothetical protein